MWISVSINMRVRLKDASVCVCPQLGGRRARCVCWGRESRKALRCLFSPSPDALEVGPSLFDHFVLPDLQAGAED